MSVLPLIITHDFHGHAQEDHSGVVVQGVWNIKKICSKVILNYGSCA